MFVRKEWRSRNKAITDLRANDARENIIIIHWYMNIYVITTSSNWNSHKYRSGVKIFHMRRKWITTDLH
jgi:hypothetical protein